MSSISTRYRYINLLFLLLLFIGYTASAQIVQSARFELPVGRNEVKFGIIPAHQDGLFLIRRLGSSDVSDQLELARLDTAFQQIWHGYLEINKKYILVGARAQNEKLFLLSRYMDYSKNDFELVSMAQKDGSYIRYAIKNFIPFNPIEFQITQNGALMGGYYNRVPVVMFYSFTTEKSKILPGLLNESGELTQLKTYPDGSFDVLISAKNIQGIKTIWIKNYDANADLIRNYSLDTDDKHLIFAQSLKTNNNMQVVAGVFGTRNAEYSRGLFMATIDPSGMQQIRYYNFADLQNFFKYMKAKREQRVKARIERKKIRGKKIRFNYRFLVHELVPYKDQYILLGEAFYPKYITVDSRTYGSFFTGGFSNSYVRNGRIFDGYYYTHAVVMGFNHNGDIMWDNSFEINDVRTFTLEQFVKLEAQPDRIALLYLYDNVLRSKIIKDNQVLEGKTSEAIRTNLDREIIDKEEADVAKLDYWYKDYFYAFGVQDVINPGEGKRRVFFINKLSYE
ncbi:MAG TPA: hypothetical protein VIN08_07365 [Ohtaekwangia sp.]|uniref:hypothetical protein n=1 Tax=Ohtaekwangia sp. TaxID=2066019 RepID=UPI002F959B4D